MNRSSFFALLLLVTGCGGDDAEVSPSPPVWESDGSHPVGSTTLVLEDTVRGRLPVATGLSIASSTAVAFFGAELLGDASGLDYIHEPHPAGVVSVELRD